MTRVEAIEVLQQDIPCERDTDLIEAIEMAIKALEQEPSDDCISRQAVLNTEYQVKIINDIEYVMLSEVQMKMRKLPFVNPQPICEEREKGECPYYAG